jgi:NAD(P)-dependent dehydrogenase (short-subunit alcohol dehydrogenase family)
MALAGARVVLVGRGEEALAGVRDSIGAAGGTAEILPWDLATGDTAAELITAAEDLAGPVDTLVHAAGNQVRSPALDFRAEDWDAILGLHLRSAFLLAQSLGRGLVDRSAPGSIVFIGSLTSQRLGLPGIAAYAAAKSGLLGLARTLAAEWAPYRIRVNTVLPGFVATEMTRDVDGTPERDALTMRAPLRRLGAPADIGAAAVYLASGAAGFVTGETITVDGGWSIA